MLSLFRRKAPAIAEERASQTDESWAALSFGLSGSLSVPAAEELAATTACVDLVANSLASVPAYLYAVGPDGVKTELPAPTWMQRPCYWLTWPALIAYMVRQCLLYGVAYAQVVEDRNGKVIELRPWPSSWVSMTVGNGKVRYSVTDAEGFYGAAGRQWRILGDEMLVLSDAQNVPCRAVSRLQRARAVFAHAQAAEEAAGASLANGARPSGVLTSKARLDPESRRNLAGQLKSSFSGKQAGGVLILDGEKDFKAINLSSAADQQLLESRRLSTEQICSVFGVPPVMIGVMDKANYSNSTALQQAFCFWTLLPWARKIEAEFSASVLPADQRLELDLSGLMRADYGARWTANKAAVDAGILSVNDIRLQEGFSPVEGDMYDKPRTFNQAGTEV